MSNLSDIYMHCNEIEALADAMHQELMSRPISTEEFVQFLKNVQKIDNIMIDKLDSIIKTNFL